MNPMAFASQVTGLPKGLPSKKKPTHRGRKPSGKPGAQHLAKLQQAHGAGDLAAAKTHALNFAKSLHQAMATQQPQAPDEPEGMDNGTEEPDTPMTAVSTPMPMGKVPKAAPPTMGASAAPNRRAQLAKLAMLRKK